MASEVVITIPKINHECGCITGEDLRTKITRNYLKCKGHSPNTQATNEKYYEALGALKDGVVQSRPYIDQLFVALNEFGIRPPFRDYHQCRYLEIGAGVGNYLPYFLNEFPIVEVVEASYWATRFIEQTYNVPVLNAEWAAPYTNLYRYRYDFIMAAHVIEHMDDAPGGLQAIYNALLPGGKCIIIVPDDEDLLNPDHLWFFNKKTLVSTLMDCGFVSIRTSMHKLIERESFIFCYCERP